MKTTGGGVCLDSGRSFELSGECRRKERLPLFPFSYLPPLGSRVPTWGPVIPRPTFLPHRSLCSWCLLWFWREGRAERVLHVALLIQGAWWKRRDLFCKPDEDYPLLHFREDLINACQLIWLPWMEEGKRNQCKAEQKRRGQTFLWSTCI